MNTPIQPSTTTENTSLKYVSLPQRGKAHEQFIPPIIERTRLQNGVEVVECQMPDRNVVAIECIVGRGSRNERQEHAGAIHFCEHMFCGGTTTKGRETSVKITDLIERVGGRVNAYTSNDRIALSAVAGRKGAELALDLCLDRMLASEFSSAAVEQQRGAIMAEISSTWLANPGERMNYLIESTLFKGSSEEHHVLGTRESVSSFSKELLVKISEEIFKPEDLVVIIAGGYSQEFSECVKTTLAALTKNRAKSDLLVEMPIGPKELKGRAHSPHIDQMLGSGSVDLVVVFPGIGIESAHRDALRLFHYIVGNGSLGCRLNKVMREEKGLTYGGRSYLNARGGIGYQRFGLGVQPQKLEQVVPEFLDFLDLLREHGISAEELQIAKEKRIASDSQIYESIPNVAFSLGQTAIRGRLYQMPFRTFEEDLAALHRVTLDEINHLAATLLKPTERQIFMVGDVSVERGQKIVAESC
jgi:predicted Zn-dependent peptidase